MLAVVPFKEKVLGKKQSPRILFAFVPVLVSYLSATDLYYPVSAAEKKRADDFYDLTLEELMQEKVNNQPQKKDRRKV